MAALPAVTAGIPRELWAAVRERVRPATFLECEALDEAIGEGIEVLLVSETFQHTGSFKYRAAMGVALAVEGGHLLTASSGNFGAALARAARETGKRCTVVMPAGSVRAKIAAVGSQGATVDRVDTGRISRWERVAQLREAHPEAVVVSPYDDPRVVAGNATLGAEIFERTRPDFVVVPVGGGGLASGIVVARDELAPGCRIVGAEPALADDAARSLVTGQRVSLASEPATICDGARTLSLGVLNFEILRSGLDSILTVPDATVEEAVRLLFARANLKAEPTGALALAALLAHPQRFAGRRVACVVSGGNADPELYARIVAGAGDDALD